MRFIQLVSGRLDDLLFNYSQYCHSAKEKSHMQFDKDWQLRDGATSVISPSSK